MQQTYQISATNVTAAASGVASIDVRADGDIVAIYGVFSDLGLSSGQDSSAELSFNATESIGTNDATSVLAFLQNALSLTTSGAANMVDRCDMEGLKIPVAAGERLFIHVGGTPGAADINFLVVIDEKGTSSRNVRRR